MIKYFVLQGLWCKFREGANAAIIPGRLYYNINKVYNRRRRDGRVAKTSLRRIRANIRRDLLGTVRPPVHPPPNRPATDRYAVT